MAEDLEQRTREDAAADRRIERVNPARRFLTPADALQAVHEGNERFVNGKIGRAHV